MGLTTAVRVVIPLLWILVTVIILYLSYLRASDESDPAEGASGGQHHVLVIDVKDQSRQPVKADVIAFVKGDFWIRAKIINKVAGYKKPKIKSLLNNPDIIRNRLKINAAVTNAQAFIQIRKEFGTFNKYIWGFVDHRPLQNSWKSMKQLPAKTELAETISKDLKKRGFSFVGPTIVYSHMQATGMVNDHTADCFRYREVKKLSAK